MIDLDLELDYLGGGCAVACRVCARPLKGTAEGGEDLLELCSTCYAPRQNDPTVVFLPTLTVRTHPTLCGPPVARLAVCP